MADRQRDSDWWIASDGLWYPPDLNPDPDALPLEQGVGQSTGRRVSFRFSTIVATALSFASAAFAASAFWSLRYASVLSDFSGELGPADDEVVSASELAWAGWSAVALLMLAVSGVLVIVWTFRTSRVLDERGPTGRRWRGGWTIGSWLIPFGNLVLPKLVFGEIERIADVPASVVPVGDDWQARPRSKLSDAWWFFWIGGVVPGQLAQVFIGDPGRDAQGLATSVYVSGASYAMFAIAGLCLAVLVHRIDRSISV